MKRVYDRRTQVKIAHWYYEQGLTQDQIAKRLLCSRQRINKIVNTLVEDGVVSININTFGENWIGLENAIESHFALKQVILADKSSTQMPLPALLGKKAAEFLDGFIQDGKVIGVSWGFTLGDTIFNMRAVNKCNCMVVQMVGGLNIEQRMIRPDEIARMLAGKLQCDYQLLYAPAVLNNEAARSIFVNDESLRQMLERMSRCDIAVVGIGELNEEATSYNQGYIDRNRLRALREEGYIGDICLNPFKINGEWEDYRGRSSIIGASIATLKKIPNVVAIAGGPQKVNAILGALRLGCIDVLVTDSDTARQLALAAGISY